MTMETTKKKKMSSTKARLWLDLVFFIVMVLVLAPQGTGIPVHEWISFLVLIPFFLHLIFDWKWIVNVTKRIFKSMPGETRFNYVLDWLLFFLFVVAMFSGVVISEAALPALGIEMTIDPFWVAIHDMSSNLMILVLGVHLAMHWKWIVTNFKKYVLRRPTRTTSQAGD